MKRLLKTVAKLYPDAWRDRYGAEFEALLEDRTPRVFDIVDVLWGAFKMRLTARDVGFVMVPCGLIGSLIALGMAFRTPPQYSSEMLINVTSRRISPACSSPNDLPPALRGNSAGICDEDAAGIDQLMQDWIRLGLDQEFLSSLIESKKLYPQQQHSHIPIMRLVDTMRANIDLMPVKGASSGRNYRIRFRYSDPQVAQDVVALLTRHTAEANIRSTAALRMSQGLLAPQQYARTFSLENGPSLPTKPVGLSRTVKGFAGLTGGLLTGLVLTFAFGSGQDSRAGDGHADNKSS